MLPHQPPVPDGIPELYPTLWDIWPEPFSGQKKLLASLFVFSAQTQAE